MPSDVAPTRAEESGPKLDFEWELKLFRGVRALFRRVFPQQKTFDATRGATLEGRERTLATVAQIVAGEPVRVRAVEGAGGVVGRTLHLPARLDAFATTEQNEEAYLLRTVIGATVVRLGEHRALPKSGREREETERRVFTHAIEIASEEHPRFAERLAAFPDVGALCGALLRIEDFPGDDAIAGDDAQPTKTVTTEIDAPAVRDVELVQLDRRELEDAVLMHTFEKIETADQHDGGARDLDGADEMDEHLEALQEVPLGKVIRSDERVASILRADVSLAADIPDVASIAPGERGVPYDEWDHRARSYRRGWCTVYPTPVPDVDAAWAHDALARHRALVKALVRKIEEHRSVRRPEKRRRDGEDVDLDALVHHLASIAAGEAGTPNLYVRRARARRDVAVTLLLDVSLSADAYIDDRRVLDTTREAALVVGEVSERLGEELSILAYASHTRNKCRIFEVRRAGEPWAIGKARIGALRPMGYTRIGPALRHAIAKASDSKARRKLVILVSDGKPTDYDRYEGRYGIEDVRQATREAEQRGVVVHGLTLDAAARETFPMMFGKGRYHVLRAMRDLPEVLGAVYGRLT